MKKLSFSKTGFSNGCTLIGSIIGAGFLTGRELVDFFGCFSLPLLFFTALCFYVVFSFFFFLGGKYGGFDGYLAAFFSPTLKKVVKALILVGSFVSCVGMLSAVNAVYRKLFPVCTLLLLVACFFIGERGIGGLKKVNLFLTPTILCVVLFLALKNGTFSPPTHQAPDFYKGLSALFYVFLNLFLCLPIVLEMGKNKDGGCFFPSVVVVFFIGVILSLVCFDKTSFASDLPLAYVLSSSRELFSALAFIGMATTLFSSYYPLHGFVKNKTGTPWITLLLGLLFLGSTFRFKQVVGKAYPVFAVLGGALFFYSAVREFIKSRKEVKNLGVNAVKNPFTR